MNLARLPLIWTEYEQLDPDQQLEYNALGKQPTSSSEEGSIVVDLDEIVTWFADKKNTIIDLRNGKRYQVSLHEEEFTEFFVQMTKQIITGIEIEEEEINEDGDN